ncbi:unnamed protein product [Adineta ricciae]|uniref:Uncharacterized protein n=1 Tax=Adineta ricciae TaxID=249248 RepID=A0A814X768_ADIRI|nr:unnamed protein product [Adineta ricciae]CAF1477262.1 unnamed protein product [Adineta ricciae]
MSVRRLIRWFHNRIQNYNLFITGEDEYEDNIHQSKDPTTILKQQRYTTWLYIFLLMIFLYTLFFIALLSPQRRTVIIENITPIVFKELSSEHGETLSCPCSTITTTYKTFVTNNISSHPVCSSVFVSREWIEALYIADASRYLVIDFRTTAKSQFDLLAALCTASKDAVFQALNDIDNQELVTVQLLETANVQSQVEANVDFILAMASSKITSILNFLQVLYQSNTLVSALNTNALVTFYDSRALGTFPKMYIDPTYYLHLTPNYTNLEYALSCAYGNSTAPAGIFTMPNPQYKENHQNWAHAPVSLAPYAFNMIDGFFGGCTPLDALLASTLDCLYKVNCLKNMTGYFPRLDDTKSFWNNTLPPSEQLNISVKNLIKSLFIEGRSTEVNYMKYFNQCSPSFCTYTTTDQINFSYIITLLISLYGGLTAILRFIAPVLINAILIVKNRTLKININHQRCLTSIHKLGEWIKQLNLFKSVADRTTDDIKQQRITTRLYLILFTSLILIFLLYHSFNTQTVIMVQYNPSFLTYKHLQTMYLNTLKCPCSKIAMPYKTFTSLSPTLHQICSSDLIGESWISFLVEVGTYNPENTWVTESGRYFQMLSSLCQLIKQTIDENVRRFLSQTFATSHVLIEPDFNAQLNATISQFTQSINISFSLLIEVMRTFMQIDQPLTIFTTADYSQLIPLIVVNNNTGQDEIQIKFQWNTLLNDDVFDTNCVCAFDTQCRSPLRVKIIDTLSILTQSLNSWSDIIGYRPLGMFEGCFTIDSLLLSTLECYFSTLDCLPIILYNLNQARISTEIPWINVHPLFYRETSTRFARNTSLKLILKEIMIEQWNPSFLFNDYYDVCAPDYCTYSETKYGESFIEILIALVSMIGGLMVVLRIITPLLIKLIFRVSHPQVKNRQPERRNLSYRFKINLKKLSMFVQSKLLNLNLFPPWTFGSDIERTTAKYYGQLSTRLYIVVLVLSIVISALYTVIRPQTLTKTFVNPSFDTYSRLIRDHKNELQCPCSTISSPYKNYVAIQPIIHQICSSRFVSSAWRMNLTNDLTSDLSTYDEKDYRRFLSAHLQFLTQLCELSNQSVEYSIQQSLSSLFITNQLLSETLFVPHIESMINMTKSSAPVTLARLLFLLRSTSRGNAFVSTYGTNFHYIIPFYVTLGKVVCHTEAAIYDNNCSCGLNTTCTVQASFTTANSSKPVPIDGLKIGCTPSESFLASTLQCFYNSSCIDLIYEMANSRMSDIPDPLNTTISRFSVNMTVADLVNELFVERWSTIMDYSSYFHICSPKSCSYTYRQQLDSFYTVTYLLGLYGGLSLILKWICPKIIYLMMKFYENRKKRRHLVEPIRNIETTTNGIKRKSLNTHQKTTPLETKPTVSIQTINSFWTSLGYCGLGLVLFGLIATLLIASTFYYIRQNNKQSKTINDVSNRTVNFNISISNNVTLEVFNTTNTFTIQDNSSILYSTYISALTTRSPKYCRQTFCTGSLYHYQALLINVSTSGYYSIASGGGLYVYGCLYNGTFDPLFPSENLIVENREGPVLGQFGIKYFFQSTETYILVVTTQYAGDTEVFWLFGFGVAPITYNQLNLTDLPVVQSTYSSALTDFSLTYSRSYNSSELIYYYQAIRINVATSGYYTIASSSPMDTCGYLYNGTFDPSFISQNLIVADDLYMGYHRLALVYFLQSAETYIVVVTTAYPFDIGTFSLNGYGPGTIVYNRLSTTDPPKIQSIYSSALTIYSPKYCHDSSYCSEFMHYYQAIQINVSTTGYYSIASESDMYTYGYLYNGTFDPSFISQNLITGNDNNTGYSQFRFVYYLQSTETYVMVVTTYIIYATGRFSLIAIGAGRVNYDRLSITGSSRIYSIYSSALTNSSAIYCHKIYCYPPSYSYQAIQINVSTSGYYRIASNSTMNTYGYLYNGTFDPSFTSQNLIIENDNSAEHEQFGFAYALQSAGTYVVVVTTYSARITGAFSLIMDGPGTVNYEQLNTTSPSIIQSIYPSALTDFSATYCRKIYCYPPSYSYQAIQINVSTSGYYTIVSNSSMDTYGYLYNGTFDPSFTSQNLIIENDNSAEHEQFGFAYALQSAGTYVVVVTTYSARITGAFSLIMIGPGTVNYDQLNKTSPSIIQSIYPSALTDFSATYCRKIYCYPPSYYYQAIQINVLTIGYYSIASNSSMDTYGYLYNGTFDPSFISQNLIIENDDGAGSRQFGLTYYLQSAGTYIVVVTTYSAAIKGRFSLIVSGLAAVTFNHEQ